MKLDRYWQVSLALLLRILAAVILIVILGLLGRNDFEDEQDLACIYSAGPTHSARYDFDSDSCIITERLPETPKRKGK